jgi:hypothetical protein
MHTFHKLCIAACLLAGEAYLFCRKILVLCLLRLSMALGVCLLPARKNERILMCANKRGDDITSLFSAYLALDYAPSITGLGMFMQERGVPLGGLTILSVYKGLVYMIHVPSEGEVSQMRITGPGQSEHRHVEILFGSLGVKDLYQTKK